MPEEPEPPDPALNGNYATVTDIRDEGVAVGDASNELVSMAIKQAESKIEAWTRRWFYSRDNYQLILDGASTTGEPGATNSGWFSFCEGYSLLQISVPIITLTAIAINSEARSLSDFIVYSRIGAPYDDRLNPRIISKRGAWPSRGYQNIALTGSFGFIEKIVLDDEVAYLTPTMIQIATKKLAIRLLDLKQMTGSEGEDREVSLIQSQIVEEEIPGYRYRLGATKIKTPTYSGDLEIDSIVEEYAYKRMTVAA